MLYSTPEIGVGQFISVLYKYINILLILKEIIFS